ncbi:MAG: MMPL family transporter [Thermoplasmata archaeon]
MFDKFADLVVRRYKQILVIWIIVLIFAVPLSQKVRDVVIYEETGGVPEDMESKIAAKLIEEKFPTSMSNSSVIIVVQGNNVTDEKTRDFILSIYDNIESMLRYVDSFFSIYTAYQAALNFTIWSVYPSLIDTQKNISLFSQLIYASPYSYVEAYNLTYPNVKSVSYNIYMLPSLYLNSFLQIDDGLPIETRNALASNATWAAIEQTIDTSNTTQVYLVSNYLNMFNLTWSDTFNETSSLYLSNETRPQDRAQNVTNIVAPKIFSFENPTSTESIFMLEVFNSINLSNWNDERKLMSVASNIANETSWSVISSMIASFGAEYHPMLSEYHTLFHKNFLKTISDINYDINLTPSQRAKISIDNIAPTFFGFNSSRPIQDNIIAQIAYLAWSTYSIYTFGNETIARNLSISFISQMSSLPTSFLNRIYDLSLISDSLDKKISALVEEIIRNGTIYTYPVQIPSQYLSKLVNEKRDTTIINVGFSKPSDDIEIQKNVAKLRKLLSELKKEIGINVKTYVTGSAALTADQEEESKKDNILVEPITVILIIILISIFFLSFVTPIIPLFNAGIAFVIAQALVVIIGTFLADIHYSVLTLMFTMILAAGSDYSIFIIARYREERVEGKNREDAVRVALTWAGESIATSGATVMIGLGALSLMSFKMVRTLGLCLAMGVGIALLVSLTLLPACILLIGNRIFWPSNKKWKGDSEFAKKRKEELQAHKGYFSRSAQFSIKNAKAITAVGIILTIPAVYGILSLETSYDFIGTMPDTESKSGIEKLSEGFGAGNVMPTYIVVVLPEKILHENGSYELNYIDSIEKICIELESVDNVERISGPSRPLGFPINFSDS